MKTYYAIRDALPSQLLVKGWMRDFLEKEVSGMPGNLHKIGYPFNEACWRSRSMTGGGYQEWWPYEQSAYWVDSIVRAAAALGDQKVLDIVRGQIDASVINDGEPFMGPVELKGGGTRNRWPHAVYFRALWAMYVFTGEERYAVRMREHYLNDEADYANDREVANAEIMYRLAEHFNDERLRRKASAAIGRYTRKGGDLSLKKAFSDFMPHIHGVSVNEDSKMGAISYLYTGNRRNLDATINAYEKLNSFYLLPDGVHTCYEATTGNESFKVHESCDISDYTYGLSFLLKATGDGKYADRIERAILNALPGATGPDFRTIQYLSCVNQTVCARNSTHLSMWENTPRMAYQPHHYPECCVGNVGRAFPNYCLNMFGDTAKGLAVNFYGESEFHGSSVSVKVRTAYPFEETVRVSVTDTAEGGGVLSLRIPGWSKGYDLTVNGKRRTLPVWNGYVKLRVCAGDELQLRFRFALVPSHSSDGGIYYSFGPLLMTLKLREDWKKDPAEPRQTPDFPAWTVTTEDSFAYALSGYECGSAKIRWKTPGQSPFWDGSYPIEITLPALRLDGWTYVTRKNRLSLEVLEGDNLSDGGKHKEGIDQKQVDCGATQILDDLVLTPRLPGPEYVKAHLGEETEITLVPYGCTRLRLTVFPKYDYDA